MSSNTTILSLSLIGKQQIGQFWFNSLLRKFIKHTLQKECPQTNFTTSLFFFSKGSKQIGHSSTLFSDIYYQDNILSRQYTIKTIYFGEFIYNRIHSFFGVVC